MKDRTKGLLHLLLVIAVIAAVILIAAFGIGKGKRGSMGNIKLGLDLAGGVSITYETVKDNPTKEELNDTKYKIQKRVESYSAESEVYLEGTNRINVDIPGVSDANKILEELGQPGSLQFLDEDGNLVLEGTDIQSATAQSYNDELSGLQHIVALTLTQTGSKKFETATSANIGKIIYIIYDNEIISSPVVNSVITGEASITGMDSFQEAERLASSIRIGSLPLELSELRSNIVGAKLGEEAVSTSIMAGAIGFVLVLIFMIVVYLLPGFAASIALTLYVGLMMVMLNIFDVTLTLPGIAGIILSIGMAVDANVIIFAKIKEEIALGKTIRSAIKSGYERALSAVIDCNVTTLIAAAVLYFKGTGTVKGFAQTLALGIIISMFTALVVTRFIMKAFYNMGFDNVKYYKAQKTAPNINYTKHIYKFIALSGVMFVIGIAAIVINTNSKDLGKAFNYDLDFVGGTLTEVTFADDIVIENEKANIRDMITEQTGVSSIQMSEVKGENTLIIKTGELNLEQRTIVSEQLIETYGLDPDRIKTESISSTISGEMKSDAIVAVIISTLAILIYIWYRFKDIYSATSTVVVLVHDVVIVVFFYALFRIGVGGTFIACLLTVLGCSINSTIVIFDRIRENSKNKTNKDTLESIINSSINQTLSRSINTTLTNVIMVMVLMIFGVDSIKQFAIPLMVGIICGTYTSVCLTGGIWYLFRKKIYKEA